MSGFVTFVSAGPGDPELLTLKGAARLQAADVVLYDDLAAGAMLDQTRKGAKLVSVGKRAGRSSPLQDHVSRLLIDYAVSGAKVVRLKSGDAGVFGRLEEEIVALRAAGIAYEIIPGVTTACAAAAAVGVPLTRRHTARRIQFITGADESGGLPRDLNWGALADSKATTAVYMGRRTFSELAQALIQHGLPPDTPAVLAETVGTSSARYIRSTIAGLAQQLSEGDFAATSVILFGPLAQDLLSE
ncbi:MAG: uroporphyrinogen-III C-methyltransferase [Hyphomicrobiaceae bacterium]